MSAIKLAKFIKDYEYNWDINPETNEKDVILFVPIVDLIEFNNLFRYSFFADRIIQCVLRQNHIAIWFSQIADYYGIELFEFFESNEFTNTEPKEE